jgi:type I restriction enzyme R subunit
LKSPFLNPFEDIERHWHNLPHWQQEGKWQFVTWRLGDSLPQEKLDTWAAEKEAWLRHNPQPWSEATEQDYHRRFSARIDEWLDAGHGECLLRNPRCASIVADGFLYFADERYDLGAFVVMPNHAHVLFRPRDGYALEDIAHSWKSYTSKEINKVLGRKGTLWQEDYWDRMIRHEAHLLACARYIEDNPVKAKLRNGEFVFYRSTAVPLVRDGERVLEDTHGRDARAPFDCG